jgi:SH3 domain protein
MSLRGTRITTRARARRTGLRRFGGALLVMLLGSAASAESGWVKDELTLNLRTGAGTQYRILGAVQTGDQVEILGQGEGWTRVRVPELGEGWIPAGFLQPEPPAGVRLAQLEAQTSDVRTRIDALTQRAQSLEEQNTELSARDESQRSEIETLTRENMELKAGARWPEWITGAGILATGMLMGAILQSISGRRARPRIRI